MDLLQVAGEAGGIALLGTALALGFRHGIDWDHIAAIADITSATTNVEAADYEGSLGLAGAAPTGSQAAIAKSTLGRRDFGALEARALWLASLYALGHATVVALLGLAALYFEAILPPWIDPLMQRVVGVTLLVLGLWVFYSLLLYWRGEADFKLQSRWMLVFAGLRRGWHWLQHRLGGRHHEERYHVNQYGPKTAFGIGMLHGIGAETGSQVLIIAAVGGAASQGLGTGMMIAFIVGLVTSNTALAFLSATGFISSSRAKVWYVLVGCVAGLFSLFVGTYFALGWSDRLPDLQALLGFIGGAAR